MDIIGYYGYRSFDIVDDFQAELNRAVRTITETPERYKTVIKGVRRCIMAHFPYVIYFTENPADLIILRVRHKKQIPLKRYR